MGNTEGKTTYSKLHCTWKWFYITNYVTRVKPLPILPWCELINEIAIIGDQFWQNHTYFSQILHKFQSEFGIAFLSWTIFVITNWLTTNWQDHSLVSYIHRLNLIHYINAIQAGLQIRRESENRFSQWFS